MLAVSLSILLLIWSVFYLYFAIRFLFDTLDEVLDNSDFGDIIVPFLFAIASFLFFSVGIAGLSLIWSV